MKSFTPISLTATLLATLSSAQQQYTIDPNSVANSMRQYWCQQQTTQCPLICLQTNSNSATTDTNSCDANSLTYSCVCNNGMSPNVSEYSQTLPYFICTEWGQQCVSNCGGNSQCASACLQDHPCGAQNPTRQNTSTLTSTMSASSSGSGNGAAHTTDSAGQTIYSGFAGQGASSTGGSGGSGGNGGSSKSGASSTLMRGWALSAGQIFGSLALVGAFVGGFAVLL